MSRAYQAYAQILSGVTPLTHSQLHETKEKKTVFLKETLDVIVKKKRVIT